MYSGFASPRRQQPDEAAALGLLQHLDKQQLQDLLDNESKFEQIIMDLSQIKNLQDDKESCQMANKSLAEYNLSKQPDLAQQKATLAAKSTAAKRLYEGFQQKSAQFNNSSDGQMSVDTALVMLQTESSKAEELAEDIASQFLDGGTPVDDFLAVFLKESTHAHCLKVKTDKLRAVATRLRQGLPLVDDVTSGVTGMNVATHAQPRTNFYSSAAAGGSGRAGSNFDAFAPPKVAMPTSTFYT